MTEWQAELNNDQNRENNSLHLHQYEDSYNQTRITYLMIGIISSMNGIVLYLYMAPGDQPEPNTNSELNGRKYSKNDIIMANTCTCTVPIQSRRICQKQVIISASFSCRENTSA